QTHQPYKLVLVGAGNHKMHSDDTEAIEKTIQDLALEAHVICTGYLSDKSLANAYSHASLYVFPSYNEGFGLPTLEAFKFNLPVLVANNSCLPEVGGDAIIAFNPYSSEDLAQKMQEVLSNPSLQESLKEKGKQRLNQFSWTNASNQLKEVFKIAALYGE
ncbi:MAG TPA: glycosyltransferase family 1 protein, partial [Sediminibacterium sp.]|nr:glycosyltransferase family 1 protein [Sediminibacterium sp.]